MKVTDFFASLYDQIFYSSTLKAVTVANNISSVASVMRFVSDRSENIVVKGENAGFLSLVHLNLRLSFLAPRAEGQRAIVMALYLSCVCKLCLQKTSQKVLNGFLPNFKGMFLRWSSFKFLQIFVFHEEFWLPWQPK